MGDIDYKGIGLAAKDIVLGIAGAAAGASGGPAGAEAVNKIGTGLDKALAMGGITADEKPKQTQADKFDRGGAAPPKPVTAPPAVATTAGKPLPAPPPREEEGPLVGDTKITVDHLRQLGWKDPQIRAMLGGPDQTSVATLTNPQVKGGKPAGVEGTSVKQVDGAAIASVAAKAVKMTQGEALPVVRGKKVPYDDIA